MPYNEETANRVRQAMRRRKGVSEKKMFGGVGFLINNHMALGVWKEFLILRLGKENSPHALKEPFTKEFDITGKAMTGWVMVSAEGFETAEDLKEWINQAVKFVRTLPAKA